MPEAPLIVRSEYGNDIDIDTDWQLQTVGAQARSKELELGSDYGSDFDIESEAILEDLLGEIEGRPDGNEEGDGRDVAFLPKAGRHSLGTTAKFFSCESTISEELCGDERKRQTSQDGKQVGSGGARREIVSKSRGFVVVVVSAFH